MKSSSGDIEAKNVLMAEALALGEMGFRVFPLHATLVDRCGCSKGEACGSPGKHPRILGWRSKATADRSQLTSWWRAWPEANIGIATGDGLVVVDLDSPEAIALVEEQGYEQTVEARSRRGKHLYFCGNAGSPRGVFRDIDIRGDGGYIVAPPSRHASGVAYEWIRSPQDHVPADLPDWIEREVSKKPRRATRSKARTISSDVGSFYGPGERNSALVSRAGSMRAIGLTTEEMGAALSVSNDQLCKPPLDAEEVGSIAMSVGTYQPKRRLDPAAVLHLGPRATSTYLALKLFVDQNDECFPSHDTLAERSGMARNTVMKGVKTLEDNGFVRVVHGWQGRSNRYTLLDPEESTTTTGAAA